MFMHLEEYSFIEMHKQDGNYACSSCRSATVEVDVTELTILNVQHVDRY
jgi:hypothetical protein